MPPTRRSKASTNTRSQPPLSFSSRTNKVTKPSIPQTSKTSKPSQPITTTPSQVLNAADEITTPSPAPEDVDKQIEEQPTTAELAIRQQVQAVKATDLSPKGSEAAEKAKGVTDAGIKRYWKAKEEGRKAARVHQQGLSIHEKILREFDLSSQFGPCIGIARLKRWKRADGLGLRPPIEVLAVLMKEEAKENVEAERAYVDKLMSSRGAID